MRGADVAEQRLRVARIELGQFQLPAEHGERRAQLVARIRHHLPLAVGGSPQPEDEVVEGGREL